MGSRRRDRGGARSLHVRGYDVPNTTDRDLRTVFEKFGNVVDVYLPKDYHTKQYRGFAYIQYASKTDADEARKKLDHTDIFNDGREVHIMWAAGERKTPVDMQRLDIERDNPHARRERERNGGPSWPRDRSPRRFGRGDDFDRDRYARKRFRSPSPSSRYRRDRSPPRRRRDSRSPRRPPRSRSPLRRSSRSPPLRRSRSPPFRRRGSPGPRRSRSPPHMRRRSRSPGFRRRSRSPPVRRSRSPPMRGRRSSRSPQLRRSRSPVGRRGGARYSPRRPTSRSPPLKRRPTSRSPPMNRRPSSKSPPQSRRPSSRSPIQNRRPSSRSPLQNRRPSSRSPQIKGRTASRSPPLKRRVDSRSPVHRGDELVMNGHGNGVGHLDVKLQGKDVGNVAGNGPFPGSHAPPKLRSAPLSPIEHVNAANSML